MESSSTDQPFSLESAALQLLEKDLLIAQMSQVIDEKNNDIDHKTDALDKKSLVIFNQLKSFAPQLDSTGCWKAILERAVKKIIEKQASRSPPKLQSSP